MNTFKNQALAAIDEIKTLIDEFGSPNEGALRTIKSHVFALETSDNSFNEKLASVESWAKIGFSVRKFQRLGLDQVKHFALSDLMTARRIAKKWPDAPQFVP